MLRLRRAATAFKPARAGIKRNSEGLATDMGRTAANLHYRPIDAHVNAFFRLFRANNQLSGFFPARFDIKNAFIYTYKFAPTIFTRR